MSCPRPDERIVKKEYEHLYPISKGDEECKPGHSWGPGARTHYLIHYVASGKGTLYYGSKQYTVRKGQIFVIFPWTVIKYQADMNDPWHYVWVTFYGNEAKEVFSLMGISPENPIFSVKNGSELLDVIRNMPSERSTNMKKNLDFSARLYDFMSLLMENMHVSEEGENSYLTVATRYIKAHYFEDISVDNVAYHIGISRKYLFAIFKKYLGVSPKDYIVNYRMKRAVELLSDDALSIGNIAYSVGYKDPLTFSKMFKMKLGTSPTEYRKSRSLPL